MADHKSMYLKLFNAVTDAVNILQNAQAEAEEMYVSQEEPTITLLDPKGAGEENKS